jgi:hypothetical protein
MQIFVMVWQQAISVIHCGPHSWNTDSRNLCYVRIITRSTQHKIFCVCVCLCVWTLLYRRTFKLIGPDFVLFSNNNNNNNNNNNYYYYYYYRFSFKYMSLDVQAVCYDLKGPCSIHVFYSLAILHTNSLSLSPNLRSVFLACFSH